MWCSLWGWCLYSTLFEMNGQCLYSPFPLLLFLFFLVTRGKSIVRIGWTAVGVESHHSTRSQPLISLSPKLTPGITHTMILTDQISNKLTKPSAKDSAMRACTQPQHVVTLLSTWTMYNVTRSTPTTATQVWPMRGPRLATGAWHGQLQRDLTDFGLWGTKSKWL